MNYLKIILDNIIDNYEHAALSQSTIFAVLFMVLVLSLLEYAVYRLVSHRSFYNKSFNIALAIIPFFIATIILSLQSNLVITLGTIGALAIIRFRTAIKNPIDMLYLLWSIHIGITCGCQLYELSVGTFIVVTVLLLIFENVNLGKKPFVLVFHADEQKESDLSGILSAGTRSYRIKSRNYTASGTDYVIEISTDDPEKLAAALKDAGIQKLSIIEYDSDDIL